MKARIKPDVSEKSKAPEFTVKQLTPHSEALFGVSQSTMAGALYDVTGKISKVNAKIKIEAWLKKEVK